MEAFMQTANMKTVRAGSNSAFVERIPLRCLMIAAMFILLPNYWAKGDASQDKDTFKNSTGSTETDFHLQVGGKFTGDPTCSGMNLNSGGKGGGTADFNGGSVSDGTTVTVSFTCSGGNPNPQGYFTPDGKALGLIASQAPNPKKTAYIPDGSGYDGTLSLGNDNFANLAGSIDVYVNNGAAAQFGTPQFDTLNNAALVYSNPAYSLAQGQAFPDINAYLAPDQYFLAIGTASPDPNSGYFPFSLAFSPVPEPSTLGLLGLGAIGMLRRPRRGA